MKILITGGAGFIASHICDKYIDLGHKVIVCDNLSTGKKENLNPRAEFHPLDVRDKQIQELIKNEKPDIINHHAAQLDVRKSVADPLFDAEVNILGLLNVLEAARVSQVKKIIFASSGGVVYGDAKTIPTPENYQPLMPLSPYGIAKLTSEHYLYYYYRSYNLPYIALRYGNVYGPRQDPFGEAGVVAIFIQKLLRDQQPVINGDGLQTRDYIFVQDVVTANVRSIESDFVGPLNLGNGRETTVNEIFHNLNAITAKQKQEVHGPPKLGEQKRSCLNITQAKKILAWSPEYSLEDGLKETVNFFKNLP